MAHKTNRRDFVKQTTAIGAAMWVSGKSVIADSKSPNQKLNVGVIGAGGKGATDSREMAKCGANIVALCDIDDKALGKASVRYENAKKFNDFRIMFEEMGDKIDAVTVSTPDHTHAVAAMAAMKLGKHVYCQKPLTWSVAEARKLRETASENGVVTQMGNQGTSYDGLREAVEVIRTGGIGTAKEVHVWTNRPVWPVKEGRSSETPPVPKHIHWDLFLGPADYRPYHPDYHPFSWRGWVDFGTGALGDMACHTANMVVMALDLFDPISIHAKSDGISNGECFPKNSVIEYQFGERNGLPPIKMTWYDGGNLPDQSLLHGMKSSSSGSLIVGEKGTLYSPNDYGAAYHLLPKDVFADYKKPEPVLPRSPGHYQEFYNACLGGFKPMSNFDYAGRLTETMILGNVSMRANQKIEWDAKNMKITNIPEANKYISREYREGWTL